MKMVPSFRHEAKKQHQRACLRSAASYPVPFPKTARGDRSSPTVSAFFCMPHEDLSPATPTPQEDDQKQKLNPDAVFEKMYVSYDIP